MKEFSIGMSLMDYIPVICFLVASVIIQRDLYNKMSKGAFALFAAGTIDVIFAGSCKATYKLLYAAGICDFEVLNDILFPVQSFGFLLAGIAVLALTYHSQGKDKIYSVAAPAVFSGTLIFVICMVIGIGTMDFGLGKIALKMKKNKTCLLIALSFICSLTMGYLSSKDFSKAYMNWIAESINIVGQGSLMVAAIILHKSGLEKVELVKFSQD